MATPRVKADADGEAPVGAKEGSPGATEAIGASVGVTLVSRVGPEAETGKGVEVGRVSEVETGVGSVVETEIGSEDDTETVEDTGLARGEELGTGIGEAAGPGRGEEMVKGAAPGAEAVKTEDELAPEFSFCSFHVHIPPFPLPPSLFPRKPLLPHTIKDSRNLTFPSKVPTNRTRKRALAAQFWGPPTK